MYEFWFSFIWVSWFICRKISDTYLAIFFWFWWWSSRLEAILVWAFSDRLAKHIYIVEASSCMLVNHGPSQQSFKEEYKPWKWGATAKYYSSHTKDHVTNGEVPAKIQQAIGPHEDLLTIVKRRKLQWYGHVSRSSGLAKTILQGTMKGGRRVS